MIVFTDNPIHENKFPKPFIHKTHPTNGQTYAYLKMTKRNCSRLHAIKMTIRLIWKSLFFFKKPKSLQQWQFENLKCYSKAIFTKKIQLEIYAQAFKIAYAAEHVNY